jgi:hypothetical protein
MAHRIVGDHRTDRSAFHRSTMRKALLRGALDFAGTLLGCPLSHEFRDTRGFAAMVLVGHAGSFDRQSRAFNSGWHPPNRCSGEFLICQILHVTTAAVLHGEHTAYILVEGVEKPTDKRSASLLYCRVANTDFPKPRRTSPHPLRAPGPAATSTEVAVPVLRARTGLSQQDPIPRQGAPRRGPRPRADVLPRGTAHGRAYTLAVRHCVDRKVTLN